MFSLPRDTVDVPLPPGPAPERLRAASTPARSTRSSRQPRTAADLVPGRSRTRGYNGAQVGPRQPVRPRHQVLRRGQLRRLQAGRRRDGRGDDQRPGAGHRRQLPVRRGRLHAALHPGRHPAHDRRRRRSSTPDRVTARRLRPRRPPAARPDCRSASRPTSPTLIPRIPELFAALQTTVRTDIPQPARRSCSGSPAASTREHPLVRVLAPALRRPRSPRPRGYIVLPKVRRDPRRGRERVQGRPAARGPARDARRARTASVWVLNGQRPAGPGANGRLSRVLRARGLRPDRRPTRVPAETRIVVYNGAEARLPATIAYLEKKFKVQARLKADPTSVSTSSSRRPDRPPTSPPPASRGAAASRRGRAARAARQAQLDRRQPVAYSGSRPRTASK